MSTEIWETLERVLREVGEPATLNVSGDLAVIVCDSFSGASAVNRRIKALGVPGFVEIWTNQNGVARRFDAVTPLSGAVMQLLTKDLSASKLIEFAETQATCCEITSMGTNKTLYTNGQNCQETEGVIWTPDQFVGYNTLQYWQGFEDDLEELLRGLKQDGRIEAFRFRNRRLDGGANEFVKDYFMTEFLGVPCRVSVTRDWRSL